MHLSRNNKKSGFTAPDSKLIGALILMFFSSMTAQAEQDKQHSDALANCPYDKNAGSKATETDRLAIEQLLREWEIAVQQEDLARLGSMVTEQAEFWTHETAPLIGRDALVLAFEPFLAEYNMQQDYQCKELIITDGWAFIRGLEVNTLTQKSTGEVRISKQRAFSVLQKDGQGQWRFARGMTHRPPKD